MGTGAPWWHLLNATIRGEVLRLGSLAPLGVSLETSEHASTDDQCQHHASNDLVHLLPLFERLWNLYCQDNSTLQFNHDATAYGELAACLGSLPVGPGFQHEQVTGPRETKAD
jgi:hypothetical protein